MADHSSIEWTDATWNPITGCSLVSPGCTNCYAMKLAGGRLQHHPSRQGLTAASKAGAVWTGQVRFNAEWLTQPIGWKRPRRIFVCAHGDLFAEGVPDEWIDKVFAVMALAPWHQFQVLTKRPERMHAYMEERWQPAPGQTLRFGGDVLSIPAEERGEDRRVQVDREAEEIINSGEALTKRFADLDNPLHWTEAGDLKATAYSWPLPNVWLGTSVEDQKRADARIPHLLATPAAVRFISAEPLLGALELGWAISRNRLEIAAGYLARGQFSPGLETLRPLDWIIVGGESGPAARPMHPDWARSLRDQCAAAGVPFFFKQWGEWAPGENATRAQSGTERVATYYDESWIKPGWAFRSVSRRASEEMHRDDEPEVWRLGKQQAGRLLDGVEHNSMPAEVAGR